MSRFDADFKASVSPDLMTQFGETVTYLPITGASRPVTMRINTRMGDTDESEHNGQQTSRVIVGTVATSEISSPVQGDRIVVDGVIYKVDRVDLDTAKGEAEIEAVAFPDQDFGEPGLRRRSR